jgi:hypothetical protein
MRETLLEEMDRHVDDLDTEWPGSERRIRDLWPRLRRVLSVYAQHLDSCKVDEYENCEAGARVKPCTCGFREACGMEP